MNRRLLAKAQELMMEAELLRREMETTWHPGGRELAEEQFEFAFQQAQEAVYDAMAAEPDEEA